MTLRTRGEHGTIAIVFALSLVFVLVPLAALAVDLGNAYQRQREVQSQADLAALAGGASLPSVALATAAVQKSLDQNHKVGQGPPQTIVSPSAATATCPDRPEATLYFSSGNARLKVCAPRAQVAFGFAGAFGMNGKAVTADATVSMGTPGSSAEMPFYAVGGGSGCDWGPQALTDPANGKVLDTTPTISSPSDPRVQDANITVMNPAQIISGATSASVRISGSGLTKVTAVGFYRETSFPLNRVEPGALPSASDSTGKSVDFAVPSQVLADDGVWYVKVFTTGNNSNQTGWSAKSLPLRIGDPVITCPSVSRSGNFGALVLPRSDSTNSTSNGWMPNNIAKGLQEPFSLAIHAQATSPWTCSAGVNGAVYSAGAPGHAGTNCVQTDTGLTASATTAGLVTGTNLPTKGRLASKPTSTGVNGARSCGPGGSSASATVLGTSVNNDTLSCYLINPSTPIGTIASSTYAGAAALSPAIYKSPRFCYVPVLNSDPSQGRSSKYSIVSMRPCFITGETVSSTWNLQSFSDNSDNGLSVTGSRVTSLQVVFFSPNALPGVADNVGDYVGVGPKAVKMID
jgi:Flp pilus assembly protein TadG